MSHNTQPVDKDQLYQAILLILDASNASLGMTAEGVFGIQGILKAKEPNIGQRVDDDTILAACLELKALGYTKYEERGLAAKRKYWTLDRQGRDYLAEQGLSNR